MISRETYRKLRDMTRRFEAARKQYDPKRYQKGGGYDRHELALIADMAGTRDATNDEKGQIEDYEWRMFPPTRYFGYYTPGIKKITGFMGNVLGTVVWRGVEFRDNMGGKRVNVVVRGTNNVMYQGTCILSAGNYCRLKRISGKQYGPGVLPNAKRSKLKVQKARKARKVKKSRTGTGGKYTLDQILDYYAGRNPGGKHFMAVAVSRNTNSFGLYGVVLMARDGEAWEVAASSLKKPRQGDLVRLPYLKGKEYNWAAKGFEIPRRLPAPPPQVVSEVWG